MPSAHLVDFWVEGGDEAVVFAFGKKLQIPLKLVEIFTPPPDVACAEPGYTRYVSQERGPGQRDWPLHPPLSARSPAHSGRRQSQCLFQQGSFHHGYRLLPNTNPSSPFSTVGCRAGQSEAGASTSEGNSRQEPSARSKGARRGGNSLNQTEERILTMPESITRPRLLVPWLPRSATNLFSKKGRRGVKVASPVPCLLPGSGRSVPAAPSAQGCQARGSTALSPSSPAGVGAPGSPSPLGSLRGPCPIPKIRERGSPGAALAQAEADPACSRLTYLST